MIAHSDRGQWGSEREIARADGADDVVPLHLLFSPFQHGVDVLFTQTLIEINYKEKGQTANEATAKKEYTSYKKRVKKNANKK